MRQDQLERLRDLAERLADVYLTEADPDNWTGDGKLPNEMTKQERGDRHWDRKGAMATGGVLRYTLDILARDKAADTQPQAEGADPEHDSDLETQIKDAEKRAAAAVHRVLNKAQGKAEFDKRVHGR